MQRIPQALQLPVIVNRSRPPGWESQHFQKFDFFFSGIAAQGGIPQEFFQSRLYGQGPLRFLFHKLKALQTPRANCRFKTISILNVSISISQESISGSRKETQLSTETLNTSTSRNSRITTRICS